MTFLTVFGIDLGTVNSCIAHVDTAGHPVVLRASAEQRETTPSVVFFGDLSAPEVGASAKNSALLAPHLVARLFKVRMGDRDARDRYHDRDLTPWQISAHVLRALAEGAQAELDRPVRDVVITVPAEFGLAARERTVEAGRLAGLNVLDVLDEPVAAALSYRHRFPAADARVLLVYDLGGGTFDTSVIRIDDAGTAVVCIGGDRNLGGALWDERIVAHLREAFRAEHPHLDPWADPAFRQQTHDRAEELKRRLSGTRSATVPLRFAGEVTRVRMTREEMEKMTADLLEETLRITAGTLADAASKGVTEIDEVVLVGGMTRMPVIEESLRERFGKEVRRYDPDLAVVRGAALYAATRQEESTRKAATGTTRSLSGGTLSTVVARAIGVRVVDEHDPTLATDPTKARQYVMHLLHAGTPLPNDTGAVTVTTFVDNQPMLEVDVWEARTAEASPELTDNERIGTGLLRLPPRTPARTPVSLTLLMSESGRLTVRAVDPRTGEELSYQLQLGGIDRPGGR